MLSEAEIDALTESARAEDLEAVHPCLGCPSAELDPEYCRGCADFEMCPGLQPEILLEPGPEQPAYRELFRRLHL